MLQKPRKSRLARALLLAAGLLAVLASFGLHPEPEAAAASSGTPAWSAQVARTSPSHECPACLTHRPFSPALLTAVVLRPQSIVAPAAVFLAAWPERHEVRPHQNRAPPVVS
ncbi:MAG: hypothetical protein ACRD1B_01415 [Thermoanaerobaculia bacterium]